MEHTIPEDLLEELYDYLKTCTKSKDDDEAIGKQIKRPIVTVQDVSDNKSMDSDASKASKMTVRIYEVREGKMQVVKGMAQLGKTFNPNADN